MKDLRILADYSGIGQSSAQQFMSDIHVYHMEWKHLTHLGLTFVDGCVRVWVVTKQDEQEVKRRKERTLKKGSVSKRQITIFAVSSPDFVEAFAERNCYFQANSLK
ncbi:hypothetical protein Tcan_00866, partial [Toxocara canis]